MALTLQRRSLLKVMSGMAAASALPGLPAMLMAETKATSEPAASKPCPRFHDGRDWFFEKRFGLMVNLGIYAVPAWHEQIQWRLPMSCAEYAKFAAQLNPTKYDPDAWLDLAAEAGMKYVCFDTKHHDGFCLWDTKQTAFNVMNTPYGRDMLKMMADACHRRGVPLVVYYSCVDWHHPNYPNKGKQGHSHELDGPEPGDEPDLAKYMEFVKAQTRELCTNYGEIHGFWWDIKMTENRDPSLNAMIRQLQPKAVINNRGYSEGDFNTPERDYQKDEEVRPFEHPTEACQSVGIESWGYKRDEDYYTDRHLIRGIDRYLARDANYLLNVGPMADGTFSPEAVGILQRIGKWYHAVAESLEGVVSAWYLTDERSVLLTRRDNTLYVHLHTDPIYEAVKLTGIDVAPRRATLLNTGQPVEFAVDRVPTRFWDRKPFLRLRKLPVNEMANTVLVVKIEFDHLPG